jgi:hypothetical protein
MAYLLLYVDDIILTASSIALLQATIAKLASEFHFCHTQFLRPKPDTHRMYAQDQVVIHTVRM